MKRNSTASMGAFHPAIFLLLVYVIALFMSLFVCRIVYYTINESGDDFPAAPHNMQHVTAMK